MQEIYGDDNMMCIKEGSHGTLKIFFSGNENLMTFDYEGMKFKMIGRYKTAYDAREASEKLPKNSTRIVKIVDRHELKEKIWALYSVALILRR